KENLSKSLKNLKSGFSLFSSFFIVLFCYSPFLFSEPYRIQNQGKDSNGICEINQECLDYLHNEFLNAENDYSIYQMRQEESDTFENCCANLDKCPSLCSLNQGLEALKSDLLNFSVNQTACSSSDISSLIHSILDMQKEVCHLKAKNFEMGCEDKPEGFKRSIKSCFFIGSNLSLDEVLKQAESAQDNLCYEHLKELAQIYEIQSLNGGSELREELSVQDIADCEGIKNKANRAVGARKTIEICNLVNKRALERQLAEPAKKEEEEKQAVEIVEDKESGKQRADRETESQSQRDKKLEEESKNNPENSQESSFRVFTLGRVNERSNSLLSLANSFPKSALLETISLKEPIGADEVSADLLSGLGKGQIAGVSNTQADTSKGLFKKTVDKAKSAFKKAVDVFKNILPFFDSEKELIAKADKLCRAKSRLLSMSQVVYQSVKAPQKERLDEEGRRPFDDYDLIRGKPAGVIVKIRKSGKVRKEGLRDTSLDFDAEEMIKEFNFSLSLKINGEPYNETLCSKELKEEDVNYKVDLSKDPEEVTFTTENANCVFNWEDLKGESIYKFMSLPTKLGEPLGKNLDLVEVEILSQLKPKNSIDDEYVKACESSKDFKANMLDSKSFKILFTGIEGPYCGDKDNKGNPEKAYRTTTYSDIRDYLSSTELRKDFYDMFPVSNRRPYKPEISLLRENNQLIFPVGSCDTSLTGIYYDAFNLHHLNLEYGGDRIIAVFDRRYKRYHEEYFEKNGNIRGLAFTNAPSWYIPTPFGDIYMSHGINTGVAIVQEGRYDQGVFLHELAHTLGQLKEYYAPINQYQKQQYCSQFTSRKKLPGKEEFFFSEDKITGIPCYDYRVTGGLVKKSDITARLSEKPRRQVWKLLNNQESIMHSTGFIRDSDDNYLKWMDRETHQKVLATIQNDLIIPEDFFRRIKGEIPNQEPRIIHIRNVYNNILNCAFQKRPVIVVTGIYNEKGKDRFKAFSARAYRMKNSKNPFSFSKISMERKTEDHIRVELKRKGQLDQALLFPRKFYMEVFYEDGKLEQKEMESSPIFASFFPACESFNEKSYTVSVKEVFIESGVKRENTLIDSAPIKLEKDRRGEIL
ncbi:MAG: hypothetical protein OXJ52_00275, partial [Oligoflexia bacterium]|nr:hypothetical protein [Oligoflexia bacterium]